MLAPAARELSAIAAVGRICLLAGALATGFHQSYAAGMDALQGSDVNEGAVAGAGGEPAWSNSHATSSSPSAQPKSSTTSLA
ncbi:conserved hypothetical protein [Mycobacterium marinum E11]|nr:conserved hypothetical protein [Mycobacterium marinum E11]